MNAAPAIPALRTGWEPDCPGGDTVTRQAVVNLAARVEHMTAAAGGRLHGDERWMLGDQGLATPFANVAVALQPVSDPDEVAMLGRFFSGPFLVMSAWPTPVLDSNHFTLVGHPPFMLRPSGGAPPRLPEGVEITEVDDRATALRFERTLIEGYPIPEVDRAAPGSLFDDRMLGRGLRAWVASVDGVDVSVATAFSHAGLNQVEMVATHPDVRGRGYGAAVTWQATMADPALPAVLIASDDGRSVYERLGFIALTRWTLWLGSPGSAL